MRLYMRTQDGQDKYAEVDHKYTGFMPGDIVITHEEELFHELAGTLLLENNSVARIMPPQETYSLDKEVSALVFFTKLPHSVSIKRSSNSVRMTVTM